MRIPRHHKDDLKHFFGKFRESQLSIRKFLGMFLPCPFEENFFLQVKMFSKNLPGVLGNKETSKKQHILKI